MKWSCVPRDYTENEIVGKEGQTPRGGGSSGEEGVAGILKASGEKNGEKYEDSYMMNHGESQLEQTHGELA